MDSEGLDKRSVSILYVSLFNQRVASKLTERSWQGDWLFRRERLLRVDRFLRERKPDIIIFQEMMAREGSFSESDRKIIGEGSLKGYLWDQQEMAFYDDTKEFEYHGIAAGLPVKPVALSEDVTRHWHIPGGGDISFFLLEMEGSKIPIFNVQMDSKAKSSLVATKTLEKVVRNTLRERKLCPFHLLIAGKIPLSFTSSGLSWLKQELQVRDISEGFCEVASDCYNATPVNDIFAHTSNRSLPMQLDRVFVHRSATVISSSVELNEPIDDPMLSKQYGISQLWPLERFAWYSSLRFEQCSEDDFY